jgi:tRNA(fMet)-specific endonuclease VapC
VYLYSAMEDLIIAFSKLPVLPFDEAAAQEYERLRKAKTKARPMDLKIAAIALCHDALVLTKDVDDFDNIPNLKVEDWLLTIGASLT